MKQQLKQYRIINLVFAGIISLIFIYSGIFSYENANHPVPSFYSLATGEETLSTGLSRSFSAIVRLQFDIAHQFNTHGLRLFLFFFLQFFLRITFFLLASKKSQYLKQVVIIDAIISTLLFIVHFEPFIEEAVYR
ncbi:MAG TPA: hypothetical protein DDX98_00980 [Bacteroidales bacterium]|nr:hypothetical protein [Bacteroidales bacterium]